MPKNPPEETRNLVVIGESRRLGETGPAYEVLRFVGDDEVEIEIHETGEVVTLSLEEISQNPLAD